MVHFLNKYVEVSGIFIIFKRKYVEVSSIFFKHLTEFSKIENENLIFFLLIS